MSENEKVRNIIASVVCDSKFPTDESLRIADDIIHGLKIHDLWIVRYIRDSGDS